MDDTPNQMASILRHPTSSDIITLGEKDNILLPGLPGKLIYTHNPAYMDDLITPSARLESLQRKADIISAFCIIFGVDIAI